MDGSWKLKPDEEASFRNLYITPQEWSKAAGLKGASFKPRSNRKTPVVLYFFNLKQRASKSKVYDLPEIAARIRNGTFYQEANFKAFPRLPYIQLKYQLRRYMDPVGKLLGDLKIAVGRQLSSWREVFCIDEISNALRRTSKVL